MEINISFSLKNIFEPETSNYDRKLECRGEAMCNNLYGDACHY